MSDEAIVQRWRKPAEILAVEDTMQWATGDLGRATLDYSARVSTETKDRIRLGYLCINCYEPHEQPFPENCALCGFPMRERQSEDFARKYEGVERDPRAKLIERELDRVDDVHERRFYTTKSGVVVPRGVINGTG